MEKYTNHVFAEVPKTSIPRSCFRMPSNLKTTINTDYLYPIYCSECLPGDTWKMNAEFFGRLSTPMTPIMDDLYLDTFFFAIPVRLVDDTFKRLMGERPFGDVRNDYTTPVLNTGSDGVETCSLSDYLGIPPGVKNLDFVPWWHRAYNLCYNEWFRDENLCPARPVAGVHEDGTVTTESLSDYVLCRRGKRKDYFTGCLPWMQKGENTTFALANTFLISNYADNHYATASDIQEHYFRPRFYAADGSLKNSGTLGVSNDPGLLVSNDTAIAATRSSAYMALEGMFSEQALISINQLREAFAIQHLLEADARGGSRYTELVRAHFNVYSPDARLQRPEYLGGSSQVLSVNTVPQSASQTNLDPEQDPNGNNYYLGSTGAFVTVSDHCSWSKTFTEHTLILGIANVRSNLTYQQGLHRMFSRRTKYDFYWPELANLSEQVVFNREIYAQGNDVTDFDGNIIDDQPFGYQERFAEYRYQPSRVTGKFRSGDDSLDWWHLAQKFASLPALNQTFIEEHVPIDRVLYIPQSVEPGLLLDCFFDVVAARPMPVYSVPGLSRL